jgi:hypothetical protein
MRTIQYLTKDMVIALNNRAIADQRNKTLVPAKLERLDPDVKVVVYKHFIHNDSELRLVLIFDAKGSTGLLDVPLGTERWIPTIDIDDEA